MGQVMPDPPGSPARHRSATHPRRFQCPQGWSLGTVTGWPMETADEMRARAATYKVCAAELAGVRDLEMYYSDPWRVER